MRVEQIIATPTHIELYIPELPLVSKVSSVWIAPFA